MQVCRLPKRTEWEKCLHHSITLHDEKGRSFDANHIYLFNKNNKMKNKRMFRLRHKYLYTFYLHTRWHTLGAGTRRTSISDIDWCGVRCFAVRALNPLPFRFILQSSGMKAECFFDVFSSCVGSRVQTGCCVAEDVLYCLAEGRALQTVRFFVADDSYHKSEIENCNRWPMLSIGVNPINWSPPHRVNFCKSFIDGDVSID